MAVTITRHYQPNGRLRMELEYDTGERFTIRVRPTPAGYRFAIAGRIQPTQQHAEAAALAAIERAADLLTLQLPADQRSRLGAPS